MVTATEIIVVLNRRPSVKTAHTYVCCASSQLTSCHVARRFMRFDGTHTANIQRSLTFNAVGARSKRTVSFSVTGASRALPMLHFCWSRSSATKLHLRWPQTSVSIGFWLDCFEGRNSDILKIAHPSDETELSVLEALRQRQTRSVLVYMATRSRSGLSRVPR